MKGQSTRKWLLQKILSMKPKRIWANERIRSGIPQHGPKVEAVDEPQPGQAEKSRRTWWAWRPPHGTLPTRRPPSASAATPLTHPPPLCLSALPLAPPCPNPNCNNAGAHPCRAALLAFCSAAKSRRKLEVGGFLLQPTQRPQARRMDIVDGGRRSFGQEKRLWMRDKTVALVN